MTKAKAAAGLLALWLACAPASASAQTASPEPWPALRETAALPEPVKTGLQDVGDVELYYAVYGKGPPVIFLHPGLGHSDFWANQIGPISRTHRVIVVDLRGHGRSTGSDAPLSYRLIARDIMRLIQRQKLGKPVIVGWGDGAIVGLELARRHPRRIERLVAFGLAYDISGRRPDAGRTPAFADYAGRTLTDQQRLTPQPDRTPTLLPALQALWAAEPRHTPDDLGAIRTPTAILAGEHDEWVRLEHMEEAARLIPDAQIVVIPQAGHFAPWQTPKRFNDLLRLLLNAGA